MTRSAAALYATAVADSNAGRPSAARRALRAAQARAPDADLAARIEGTLAYLDAEVSDPETALERIRAATGRPGISSRTRAVLLGQAGLVAMRRGQPDAALRDLGRAIARLRDDPPRLGQLTLNRGDVHLQRGDLHRAEADFATARAAFAAARLPIDEAKARHNLGYTALLAGDLVRAIREMDAARGVLGEVSPVVAATCDADRATALLAAGMPGEAEALLGDAIRCYGRGRLRQEQGEAELLLARTVIHRDPARAERIARRAAGRFRARGAEAWALEADGWALSAVAAGGGRGGALASRLEAVASSLRAEGLRTDAARVLLRAASVRIADGDLAAAAGLLRRAAPSPTAAVPLRLLAWQVRAELAAARGRPRSVLRAAGAGLDELARARSRLGAIDLQTSLLLHARPLLERGIATAADLGRPDLLLEWTERARDVVARVQPLDAALLDPGTTAALEEVRRLRAFGGGGAREDELLAELRDRLWQQPGSGAVRPGTGVGALQERLDAADAAAIAFCRVGGRYAAVVLTAGTERIVRLASTAAVDASVAALRADLELAAARPEGAVGVSVAAALRERLAILDGALLAPLGIPPVGGVVLSVPGALSGVPWSMLPRLTARPVTVPVSLAAWVGAVPHPAPASAGFVAGPGVQRAGEETDGAARAWRDGGIAATVLQGADASVRRVGELASRVDLLHVAAHGRHSAEQPLLSGVELADGPFFGYDVGRQPRVPGIVVLSACEVGRSAVTWGEETVGMARAWLHAGSHCVIASAASVDDDVASRLLPEVHRRLAAGAAPAVALAGSGTTFVCFGNGL